MMPKIFKPWKEPEKPNFYGIFSECCKKKGAIQPMPNEFSYYHCVTCGRVFVLGVG